MRVDEVNVLFKAYIVITFLCCLLTPDSLGVAASFGWDPAHIPVYSWIAEVRGVLPFYADDFSLTWIMFPIWLLAYGAIYIKNYSSAGVNIPLLIAASIVIALILALIVFGDVHASDDGATGRERLIALAARIRILGAFIFSGIMTFVFALSCLVFVKSPIDLVRNMRTG